MLQAQFRRLPRPLVAALLLTVLASGVAWHTVNTPAGEFITAPVERRTIAKLVRATGSVEAVRTVEISSPLSGTVAQVFVTFNDTVKAGQKLAELDRGVFAARVAEAKAAVQVALANVEMQRAAVERAKLAVGAGRNGHKLAEDQAGAQVARQKQAEDELRRKLDLARTGTASQREVSQVRMAREVAAADLQAALDEGVIKHDTAAMAEAELRMAEAELQNAAATVEQKQAVLDQARLDLDRTVLRAPIDGVVIKRVVDPGQTVAVALDAKMLFKIAGDLHQMEVHAKVDEADIGQLRVDQPVRFTVDAYPGRGFAGRVLQIRKAPEVEQNVVTYTAVISADNPDLVLLPGMTASLRISASEARDALTVPNQALRFRPSSPGGAAAAGSGARVWVIGSGGSPVAVPVQLGLSDDAGSEVLAGSLKEGEPVVLGLAEAHSQPGFFGIRLGF